METPNASMTIPRASEGLAFSRSLLRSTKCSPEKQRISGQRGANQIASDHSESQHATQRAEKRAKTLSELEIRLLYLPWLPVTD